MGDRISTQHDRDGCHFLFCPQRKTLPNQRPAYCGNEGMEIHPKLFRFLGNSNPTDLYFNGKFQLSLIKNLLWTPRADELQQ